VVGRNFRLDTIQAAYLGVKLRHLDAWSDARRRNAARYDQLLAGLETVVTPTVREHNVGIYNQYVIRAERRDELAAFLKERRIGTAIYYPLSLHEQACFRELGYGAGDFPESERAARESLALPIYPELTDAQLRHVAASILAFYAGG
jgi:dTDP-4-amino-4,6-dideoxygalactose transaminase